MKMIDMKSKRKKSGGLEVASRGEDYPYGLSISLNKESIKKLGLKSEDLVAGAEIDFCICVRVTSTRIEAGDKELSSCDMQIIKMGEMPEEGD